MEITRGRSLRVEFIFVIRTYLEAIVYIIYVCMYWYLCVCIRMYVCYISMYHVCMHVCIGMYAYAFVCMYVVVFILYSYVFVFWCCEPRNAEKIDLDCIHNPYLSLPLSSVCYYIHTYIHPLFSSLMFCSLLAMMTTTTTKKIMD